MHGIDVAAFQHPNGVRINWPAVAAAGYKFAAVKATEGNYYVNPWATTDLSAAKKAGLYVTAYHFAIPNASGGAAQAGYAVRHGKYVSGGHMLPLMLDIEYDPYAGIDGTNECYGLSHARMTSWIAAFVAAARNLTGQLPVIYTTAGWWAACTGRSKAFGADPMWVAAYGFASPPMPAGWSAWTFWQYTATGTVRGVDSPGNTDLSLFNISQVGLVNPGGQRTLVGAAVALQVNALDAVAKRPLSYKATGLPPGLAISNQGVIKGAPGAAGTYHVTVSAKNSSGGNGSVQFTWQVSAAGPAGLGAVTDGLGHRRLACQAREVDQGGFCAYVINAACNVAVGSLVSQGGLRRLGRRCRSLPGAGHPRAGSRPYGGRVPGPGPRARAWPRAQRGRTQRGGETRGMESGNFPI